MRREGGGIGKRGEEDRERERIWEGKGEGGGEERQSSRYVHRGVY